jgi:hypothetical protein
MGVIVRLVGIEFRGEREGEVDLDIFTTPWENCTARISLRKEGTLGLATTKLSLFVSYLHTIVDHYDRDTDVYHVYCLDASGNRRPLSSSDCIDHFHRRIDVAPVRHCRFRTIPSYFPHSVLIVEGKAENLTYMSERTVHLLWGLAANYDSQHR